MRQFCSEQRAWRHCRHVKEEPAAHVIVVGRSGWSINGNFLLVKSWSQYFCGTFFSTFWGGLSTYKNPNQESPEISCRVLYERGRCGRELS